MSFATCGFRDHSDAFWNEVDKVLPRYQGAEGMA